MMFYLYWTEDFYTNDIDCTKYENIFSCCIIQKECEFAKATAMIKNPRKPIVEYVNKKYAVIAMFNNNDLTKPMILFRGSCRQLPIECNGSFITIEFISHPPNYSEQIQKLADKIVTKNPYIYNQFFATENNITDLLEINNWIYYADPATGNISITNFHYGKKIVPLKNILDESFRFKITNSPIDQARVHLKVDWLEEHTSVHEIDIAHHLGLSNIATYTPMELINSIKTIKTIDHYQIVEHRVFLESISINGVEYSRDYLIDIQKKYTMQSQSNRILSNQIAERYKFFRKYGIESDEDVICYDHHAPQKNYDDLKKINPNVMPLFHFQYILKVKKSYLQKRSEDIFFKVNNNYQKNSVNQPRSIDLNYNLNLDKNISLRLWETYKKYPIRAQIIYNNNIYEAINEHESNDRFDIDQWQYIKPAVHCRHVHSFFKLNHSLSVVKQAILRANAHLRASLRVLEVTITTSIEDGYLINLDDSIKVINSQFGYDIIGKVIAKNIHIEYEKNSIRFTIAASIGDCMINADNSLPEEIDNIKQQQEEHETYMSSDYIEDMYILESPPPDFGLSCEDYSQQFDYSNKISDNVIDHVVLSGDSDTQHKTIVANIDNIDLIVDNLKKIPTIIDIKFANICLSDIKEQSFYTAVTNKTRTIKGVSL